MRHKENMLYKIYSAATKVAKSFSTKKYIVSTIFYFVFYFIKEKLYCGYKLFTVFVEKKKRNSKQKKLKNERIRRKKPHPT